MHLTLSETIVHVLFVSIPDTSQRWQQRPEKLTGEGQTVSGRQDLKPGT